MIHFKCEYRIPEYKIDTTEKAKFLEGIRAAHEMNEEKEKNTMKVSYNGFTGELVKLKRYNIPCFNGTILEYEISIYDSEKKATHSFTGVKLEDVKFLGGEVSFV